MIASMPKLNVEMKGRVTNILTAMNKNLSEAIKSQKWIFKETPRIIKFFEEFFTSLNEIYTVLY